MGLIAIRLTAKHDTNGNPRRVYVVMDTDDRNHIVAAVDEGYYGAKALERSGFPDINTGAIPDFETTPAEYRYLRKTYGKGR